MKKVVWFLVFVLGVLHMSNAQKIEVKKAKKGYQYFQNGNEMTNETLFKVLESNSESLKMIKRAKSNATFSTILAGAGGGLIGWPLGTALGGGDANWTLAGVGAGLIVIAIPISLSTRKNINKAVESYNSSLNSTSYNAFKPKFGIFANGNGIGLSMNF
ncbi:hypothetical protein [Aquimarina rubra]|uniref:Uncharacterized protein n=1 Tax=Aquimarina rubra TaxID=1920033 RepID=A0ABW5LIN8_9FLAO